MFRFYIHIFLNFNIFFLFTKILLIYQKVIYILFLYAVISKLFTTLESKPRLIESDKYNKKFKNIAVLTLK